MIGIKVSKPGKDVSSTDFRDFSLNSTFQAVMRIVVSGTGNVLINGGVGSTTTVNIPHTLSYPPFFQVFLKWTSSSDTNIYPASMYGADPDTASIEYIPKVDTTNLVLRFFNSAGMGGGLYRVDYYYFIGRDPL